MNNDSLKNYIRLGDKLFWMDLEEWVKGGKAIVEVVNPDGTRRPANTEEDGSLGDLLTSGHVVSSPDEKI